MAMMDEIKNLKNLKAVVDATKKATKKNHIEIRFDLNNFTAYAKEKQSGNWFPEAPENESTLTSGFIVMSKQGMRDVRELFIYHYERKGW